MKDVFNFLRNLVLLLLLIGLAVFGFLWGWDNLMSNNPDQPQPPSASDTADPTDGIRPPSHAQAARITHIHDGDTLFLEATGDGKHIDGFDEIKVRLIGIDTPEISSPQECYGDEATRALKNLSPEGSTVWVSIDTEAYDRYDRALYYLWTESGIFVNYELVAGGYAEAIRIQPNDFYYSDLKAAENEAYQAGLGMWGACDYSR